MRSDIAGRLEKVLFTTSAPSEQVHRCAVAIDETHAVSFRHNEHASYKEKQELTLYGVIDPTLEIRVHLMPVLSQLILQVVVSVISNPGDFVVFRATERKFPGDSHAWSDVYRGQTYWQLGVDKDRKPFWKNGIISQLDRMFCRN